jgi:transcriptional regulator with XRE-family HTH domain
MALTRLKQLREEAVLTVHELAEASGVSDDTISKIENGQRVARPNTLRKLARALDVSPQELRRPAKTEELAGAGKAEAPRVAGPPQVSREELVAQGIPVTDPEVAEVNYTIADLWRVIRGGKPVAYFQHDDVDPARVWMLIDLILDTPSVVTPEAADIVRQGMREKLKA